MKLSITKKIIIMILTFAIVLISVSLVLYSSFFNRVNENNYTERATAVAESVAHAVDVNVFTRLRNRVDRIYKSVSNPPTSDEWGSDAWNAYTALFDEILRSDDYRLMLNWMRDLQDINKVDSLYLAYVNGNDKVCVYVLDAAYDDPCPPGCIDPLYTMNYGVISDPERGFPAYITDTDTYGKLLTVGSPIYNDTGAVIGYSMVDVSLNEAAREQRSNTWMLLGFLSLAMLVVCIISGIFVNLSLIRPIHRMTAAATEYVADKNSLGHRFAGLKVNTHDEIADLARAMQQLESEMNAKMSELSKMNAELTKSRTIADEMAELANKDSLTGVRNKTAYDHKIAKMEQMLANGYTDFGIVMIDLNFLKRTNDNYGHEAGDAAIIRLCNLICSVYSHSPVYRIGGDEFAVVLQNHDYEMAADLEVKFRDKINRVRNDMSLKPQERVSAAIGYSLFDRDTDTSVADVFKRADKLMYEHKRAMKNELIEDRDPDERTE